MKKSCFTAASLACLSCLLSFLAGCGITLSSRAGQVKYERTVQLSAALSPGSTLAAKTHNGSIAIDGARVADCNLTATISTRAATAEEARRLAENTKIRLQRFGNKLTVKIDKPWLWTNQVSVSLDAKVPHQTNLELLTHNGTVGIADIGGRINVTTYNGDVTSEKLSGTTKVETHNGSITCKDISGDARLITHNGGVRMYCSEAARSDCEISIVTHNGGIEFAAPSDFSAKLDASASNGSVSTDLPVSVSRSRLKGDIGAGQGKLRLESHNGSIRIQ